MKMKYLPNIITVFRMMATVALLFLDAFTSAFFLVYALAGTSDVLDGWIARRTRNTSALGARLDSIADLLFYAVMTVKIWPVLLKRLPALLWCALCVVFVLRIVSYGIAAVKYGQFASLHTYMNKITGAVVFFVPFVIRSSFAVAFCAAGCAIAMLASVEELVIHVKRKTYRADVKTLLWKDAAEGGNAT